MFDQTDSPRAFALPPGVDFPAGLVQGLLHRTKNAPPHELAQVQLFVNTARMQRRIRALFAQHGASFLPQLKLITDLGRDDIGASLPDAVNPLV